MDAATVRIARLRAPRRLAFDEAPRQSPAGEYVAARTLVTAISTGTEVAAWSGAPPLRPTAEPYPRLVGYMNVAEVTAVGETVSDLSSGMHIYSHQSHRSAFVAPRSAVLAVLPPDLAPHKAAPAYLYRLGWSALRRGGFRSGMSVAVVGLGALGLATVELAVILGGRVAAVSRRQAARAAALDRGAELADEPGGPVIPAAWPERAELVVTTSNRWTDWRAALTLAAFNARVAVLGFPGRDQPSTEINPLDSALFYDKQLSLIAAGQGLEPGEPRERDAERLREDMARILAWIADGTLAPDRLVWAARPWHELAAIYGELEADAPPGVVLLDWS